MQQIPHEQVLRKALASINADEQIDMSFFPFPMEVRDKKLVLDGEVGSIAAKRLAVRLAGKIQGINGVIDQIHVTPAEPKGDGEIVNSLTQLLLGQIDLRNCALRRRLGNRIESLREPIHEYKSGEITYSVAEGTVTLEGSVISQSHRRIAEVLAWWVPGSSNVINLIAIVPEERDTDDEVSDAIHLALEMDPLLPHADQIIVNTNAGVVTLDGAIASDEEKQIAEFDAWCVPGVADVENRLAVTR